LVKKLLFLALCIISFLLLTGIDKSYALEKKEYQSTISQDNSKSNRQMEFTLDKNILTKNYEKMSSDLVQLLDSETSTEIGSSKIREDMGSFGQLILGGRHSAQEVNSEAGDLVHIYIQMNPNEDINAIYPFVNRIENVDEKNCLAAAWVNVKQLDVLSSLSTVKYIRTVMPPIFCTRSEGDDLLSASTFRNYEGVDGAGIKVGVISDGVDHWQDARNTGDLPANLHVLSNTYGGDEGTAMLEIIHDLAPGAELYFHDCGDNELAFNAAVDNLIRAGCNVICDDVYWPGQPYFEDGIVAQHIAAKIASNNIVYVSAAGNSARRHYQGNFYDDGYGYQDFSNGSSNYKNLYLDIPAGGKVLVILQWDDQFGQATNDYDLYLRKETVDGETLSYSSDVQNGSGDPIEGFFYTNNTGASIDGVIDVRKDSGNPKTLEVYIFTSNGTGTYSNNITQGDSIFGHAAVPSVISVGEVDGSYGDSISVHSSHGPVTIQYPSFEIRNKPDVCGLGGVSVSGAGGFPSPFYGTSAAAPHVAAIAALAWSNNPTQTAAQVRNAVVTGADDMGTSGYDNNYGFGRVNALGTIMTPELVIDSMDAPSEINVTSFDETCYIKNIGTAFYNSFNIDYYLSTDKTFGASDVCIGHREISGGLPARQKNTCSVTNNLTIPDSTPKGEYYLIILIDSEKKVDEINRMNNIRVYGLIKINICPTVTAINPGQGAECGGDAIIICGTKLETVTAVYFGENPAASFYYDKTEETIIAVAPAGIGIVHITVSNLSGTSLTSAKDIFSYIQMSGIISTIAGNGNDGYSGDGGMATSAQLSYPTEVAFDSNGNMYIADTWNGRIRKVGPAGDIKTIAGNGNKGYSGDGGVATSASLNYPEGVTIDSCGNMYIADCENQRIRKVNTSGIISTVAGNGIRGYSGDGGVATSASFDYPRGVAFDTSGNMYIADSSNNRIRKVDTFGNIQTVAGNGRYGYSGDDGTATMAELRSPFSLAFDNKGNMYIADSGNSCIRKVDLSGKITTVAGTGVGGYSGDGGAATSALMYCPAGIAFDQSGNLYIIDLSIARLRKVDTLGNISTIAGTGTLAYSGDGGNAFTAELYYPRGVAVDANDNVYIADTNNQRIRKVIFGSTQNSTISPSTTNFNKDPGCQIDIPVTMSLNGNTLVSITNGGTILKAGRDYTIAGSVYTITKIYLAMQPVGTTTLAFNFSAGSPADLLIKVNYIEIPFASVLSDKINQNQYFNKFFTATTNGNTVTINIISGEANLEQSFDILSLTALLIDIENELACTLDSITLAGGVSFKRSDLVNNVTATCQRIKTSIINLVDPASLFYDQLTLSQLVGKNIQIKLVNGQVINLEFQQVDECFIATAAFGSKFTWPVSLLRHFRDQFLLTTSWGSAFVRFYYRNSPPIAATIASSHALKMLVRALLAPVVLLVFSIYHPIILLMLIILVLCFEFRAKNYRWA